MVVAGGSHFDADVLVDDGLALLHLVILLVWFLLGVQRE